MIEVELSNDLVDSFGIGSDLTVTGILRVKPQEEKGDSSRIYLEAVSVSYFFFILLFLKIIIFNRSKITKSWKKLSIFLKKKSKLFKQ